MQRPSGDGSGMIDNFALALTHGLMLLAAWRLLARTDLDDDSVPAPRPPEPRARSFPRSGPSA
jgi:hypothetical protein